MPPHFNCQCFYRDPEFTSVFVAPEKTILFSAAVLKSVPLILTVVPTGPYIGKKAVIAGCAQIMLYKRMEKRKQLPGKAFITGPSDKFISEYCAFVRSCKSQDQIYPDRPKID
jgi:hypothetical protein